MEGNKHPQTAPKMRPHRHDFTEHQRKHLQPVIDRGTEIQQRIAWFMNFVMDEAGLPKAPDGYTLKFDQDGTPYMLCMVPEEPPAKK
jgi:hypothetical protein